MLLVAEISPLIRPIPGLMIWTLICFAITFFVLKRFAFGPIQNIIDERRKRIREALDEAERTRTEARELLEEHRQLRAKSRSEAEEILAEARKVAEAMSVRVREETEADRQRRLDETKKQIAAEKVTRKSLDRDDQRRLIEEAIGELDFSALERAER